VFTTAKLRLPDKLKEMRKPKAVVGTFADGRLQFERQTQTDHTLAELSKVYRLRCVASILKSWPELDALKVDKIQEQDVRDWAARYAELYAPQFFNNSLNVLRQIFALAGIGRDANQGYKIKRLGIRSKPLELPTTHEFDRLLTVIETSGAAQAKDCADLVRFLSFTGCRVAEMKKARWNDMDWQKNEITIHSVKRRITSGTALTRVVPMISALRQLLERLRDKQKPQSDDRICKVSECQGALTVKTNTGRVEASEQEATTSQNLKTSSNSLPRLAYTMRETAVILGISYITVHRLLKRGKIRASDAIRNKVIPHTEIERFLRESTAPNS
jgi:integrase